MKGATIMTIEKAGWKVGNAREFLRLTEAESTFIDLRIALVNHLRRCRELHRITWAEFAGRLSSSQSRIARMEGADASVSLDLVIKSLIAVGESRQQIGQVMTSDFDSWNGHPGMESLAAGSRVDACGWVDARDRIR